MKHPRVLILGAVASLVGAVIVESTLDAQGRPATSASALVVRADRIVTAPIERRRLVDDLSVSGRLIPGKVQRRRLPCAADGAIVTAISDASKTQGAPTGQMLLEVEGRPVVALPGAFAWYRDLKAGDSGPDGLQLNSAFGLAGSKVTAATVAASHNALAALGYATRGRRISHCELFAAPAESRSFRVHGRVGDSSDKIDMSFVSGEPYVELVVPADVATGVRAGMRFRSRDLRGTVRRVTNRKGQFMASVRIDGGAPVTDARPIRGTLLPAKRSRRQLVVPSTAIYEGPERHPYVMLMTDDSTALRVYVDVGASARGYSVVRGTQRRLRSGGAVLVGPAAE